EVLSHLREFPFLERLYLKETQASDEGLEFVAEAKNLKTLMIWNGRTITDDGVAHLRTLRNLESIHLSDSKVTDKAIEYLSEIPSLEELSMQNNDFTDKALEFARRLPRLKRLIIDRRPPFSDEGMKQVRQMAMLEELWLQETLVTNKGLRELAGLKNL